MSEILDAYEARKAADVLADTWGHLRPVKNKTYEGYILYVVGEFGDIVSIDSNFEGLESSPWFYEDLHDFIGDNGEVRGFIYLFAGTYCRDRGARFIGRFSRMSSSALRSIIHQTNGSE